MKIITHLISFVLGCALINAISTCPECPVCEIQECPSCPVCEVEENTPQLDIEIKDIDVEDINKEESIFERYKVGFDYFD